MFTLINIGKQTLKQKEPDDFGNQFMYWENVLISSGSPFMDGMEPGIRDLVMFGIVQCHASIPVPALDALLNDERLDNFRTWIVTMQKRFKGYPYLYSANFFESEASFPSNASLFYRVVFFSGLLVMILGFAFTIPLILLLMKRVQEYRIKNF